MACGGSDSTGTLGGVTYDGNTAPAVADSTTATSLVQTALDSVSSGFPVVQSLFMSDPGSNPAAVPQAEFTYTETFVMPIPAEAIVYGMDGTMTPSGNLTLLVGSDTMGDTWTVVQTTMNGNMVFDGFTNEPGGETVTGSVSVTNANIIWPDGPVVYSVSEQDFTGDPGMFVITYANLTFSNVTVDAGTADAYSLGGGDLEVSMGVDSVDVTINTLTVEHDGETSKVEDTNVNVVFTSDPEGDAITISGIDAKYGVVYDATHGWIYFSATLTEERPPDAVTYGYIELSTDGVDPDAYYYIDYNPTDGTHYNLYVGGTLVEKGYWVDWEMTPDPNAPDIIP
jgi:hypothetical protein